MRWVETGGFPEEFHNQLKTWKKRGFVEWAASETKHAEETEIIEIS